MKGSELNVSSENDRHNVDELIVLFNELFLARYQTILISGGDEPLYLPASDKSLYARVIFTKDYFASALHEIAHWCLAGPQRLSQTDYGYWYIADRDPQQQRAFESAEVKPQALEQLFSEACNFPFRPSYDNLRVPDYSSEWFDRQRTAQVQRYREVGMPGRAGEFYQALKNYYRPQHSRNRIGVDG